MSREIRVRGYGPVRPDIAETVSLLVRGHDNQHEPRIRRDIRSRISDLLHLPPSDALNVARKVDRVLRLVEH